MGSMKAKERALWASIILVFFSFYQYHGTCSTLSTSDATSEGQMVKFDEFNDDLIPSNAVLDVNIGTNYSPFGHQEDRYRILVYHLFSVCDSNSKLTSNVTSFCFAVSNFTGFATLSSSLVHVQPGTSHGNSPLLSKRTVLVLEADILFTAIHRKKYADSLQGFELTVLRYGTRRARHG